MTFLGKLLIVIQVVLSVCFMLFAGAVYSVQTNWKQKWTETEESRAALQTSLDDLQSDYDDYRTQMQADLTQAQDDAQRLSAENTTLTNDLLRVRQDLEIARTESDNQRALAQIAGDEARARRDEAHQLRDVNRELHATSDRLIARVRTLEDEMFNKNLTTKQMAEKHEALLGDYALLQKVLRRNNLDDNPDEYAAQQEPPPVVEGIVRNMQQGKGSAPDFVEITIGSDDGLLKGHELFVFRPNEAKYLGKIRLEHVTPDSSVGTVIERAKNGTIEIGDHVSTKL